MLVTSWYYMERNTIAPGYSIRGSVMAPEVRRCAPIAYCNPLVNGGIDSPHVLYRNVK